MWRDLKKRLPDMDKDDVLELLGVESRRSTAEKMVPALALFGAGVLLGVGLGLMLAPKSGSELRHDVRERLGRGKDEGKAANGKPEAAPAKPA